jgi:hypothetical protein
MARAPQEIVNRYGDAETRQGCPYGGMYLTCDSWGAGVIYPWCEDNCHAMAECMAASDAEAADARR